jgi:hypothetical protein
MRALRRKKLVHQKKESSEEPEKVPEEDLPIKARRSLWFMDYFQRSEVLRALILFLIRWDSQYSGPRKCPQARRQARRRANEPEERTSRNLISIV